MRDQPLRVIVEPTELVIRIGLDTLKMAAEYCPLLFDGESKNCDPPYCKVVDTDELAKDVARMLDDEQEDGSSPVRDLIDRAILAAMDDGSLAFVASCDIEDIRPLKPGDYGLSHWPC